MRRRSSPADWELDYVAYVQNRAPALRKLAYLLCGDWHRAEDHTQNALLRLYAAWRRVEPATASTPTPAGSSSTSCTARAGAAGCTSGPPLTCPSSRLPPTRPSPHIDNRKQRRKHRPLNISQITVRHTVTTNPRSASYALGLDHYEGRKWTGWHHHVTLVAAAHAFCTLQRLHPKAHVPA
ncbi:hypothetical protein Lfu02_73020 [Longispora fulva]|nr:hypothetical protein Lfu02_73020 [Longispora fulva]